jgi:hypothetical protein
MLGQIPAKYDGRHCQGTSGSAQWRS